MTEQDDESNFNSSTAIAGIILAVVLIIIMFATSGQV